MGFSEGTNNHAKLLALKLLLSFALEKGCNSLQVFGDSMLILNWVRKTQRFLNTYLTPLLEEVFLLITRFYVFHFMHIYREQNQKAD
jgi:ribonuclease HI